MRVNQRASYYEDVTSFYDDNFNYYVFEIGSLIDTPLENTYSYINYSGGKISHKFTTTTVSSTSIQETTQSSSTKSTSFSSQTEIGVQINIGKKDWPVSASISGKYSKSKGETSSNSISESFSKASSYSETSQHEVNISFDDSCEKGYYRYILVGVVNVYATVIQNRSNPSEYAGELFTSIKAYGYSLDFDSETPVFDDYSQEKLVFDYSEILNLPEPTIYVPDQGEVIKLNDIKFGSHPNYCPDNNGYVPYPNDGADDATRHNNFDMGEFVLKGCIETEDGLSVFATDKFQLNYHVTQYPNSLPNNGTQMNKIADDTYVLKSNPNIGEAVGYGVMWIRIKFSDGTEKELVYKNFFKNVSYDDTVSLITKDDIGDAIIQDVSISLLYETSDGGPGFLGIWWYETPNWRFDKKIEFIH